jgi:hypothetical protein
MRMFGFTSAKIVGSMKKPRASFGSAGGLPPVTRRAPSSLPHLM